MSWTPLLKIGTTVFGKGKAAVAGTAKIIGTAASKAPSATKGATEIVKTAASPVMYAAKNPKTAILAPGIAYAGWNAIVNDKPVVDSAKDYGSTLLDIAVGKERADEIKGDVGEAKNTVGQIKDTMTESKSLLGSLNESLGGIKDFIGSLSGGHTLDMLGNFFGNIGKGKVSGMSFIGLLAAGMLTFGRFGWMGKIAGAMLGMSLIGKNSQLSPSVSNNEAQVAQAKPSTSASQAQNQKAHR